MLVRHAGRERTERYNRWYPLLLEELDLVASPGARIVAVGEAVAQHLARRAFSRPVTTVLHYSDQAAKHRAACVRGREEAFGEFRDSVSLDDVLATAEDVLRESASPPWVRQWVLGYLRSHGLSESRRQLMFCYKSAFEAWGRSQTLGAAGPRPAL
jgi:hypothetical protein